MLGSTLIRISLQQQVLDQPQGALERAAKGVALLKDVGRHKDAAGFELDNAANGLLIVQPPQLQDPGLAVGYAERMVELSGHRKPSYLLTLATAYYAAGQPGKGRAAALEGIALLPAPGPTVIPSRLALQLREQAAK